MGLFSKTWFHSRSPRNRKVLKARPRRPLTVERLEDRALPTADAFLQGTAFIDANRDHTLDAGDPYLPGAVVSLYQGTGPGKVFLSSTMTDASGALLTRGGASQAVRSQAEPGTEGCSDLPLATFPNMLLGCPSPPGVSPWENPFNCFSSKTTMTSLT